MWFGGPAGEHSSLTMHDQRAFLLIWDCHPLWQNEQPRKMCVGGRGRPIAAQSASHPQETLLIGRVMLVSLPISEISFSLTKPLNAYTSL